MLANAISNAPGFARRLGGAGEVLSPLEWDVKVYLALNGALHDAAIAAWEIKRAYTTGYISGHSTFSRAAAEVLTDLTGSAFFPGGLGEFVAPAGAFLAFEPGPSVEVRLQWATYQDAADQAGQSRIWGGIHIEPDDLAGRRVGHDVGVTAVALARRFYSGLGR